MNKCCFTIAYDPSWPSVLKSLEDCFAYFQSLVFLFKWNLESTWPSLKKKNLELWQRLHWLHLSTWEDCCLNNIKSSYFLLDVFPFILFLLHFLQWYFGTFSVPVSFAIESIYSSMALRRELESVYDWEIPLKVLSLRKSVLEQVGQYMPPRGWPDMPYIR